MNQSPGRGGGRSRPGCGTRADFPAGEERRPTFALNHRRSRLTYCDGALPRQNSNIERQHRGLRFDQTECSDERETGPRRSSGCSSLGRSRPRHIGGRIGEECASALLPRVLPATARLSVIARRLPWPLPRCVKVGVHQGKREAVLTREAKAPRVRPRPLTVPRTGPTLASWNCTLHRSGCRSRPTPTV